MQLIFYLQQNQTLGAHTFCKKKHENYNDLCSTFVNLISYSFYTYKFTRHYLYLYNSSKNHILLNQIIIIKPPKTDCATLTNHKPQITLNNKIKSKHMQLNNYQSQINQTIYIPRPPWLLIIDRSVQEGLFGQLLYVIARAMNDGMDWKSVI